MQSAARILKRVVFPIALITLLATAGVAAERQRIQVDDYAIQAVVVPQNHQIKAIARVRFTALDDISIAVFTLHNGLKPTRVLDPTGETLSAERVSQDATVRVSLPGTLSKGSSTSLIFEYEGTLQSPGDSPVPD